MPLTAVIAGHSNTVCLGVPLFTEDGIPKLVDLAGGDRRFQAVTGTYTRDPPYWDLLAEVGSGRKVVIVWLGNQHLLTYLFAPSPLFDLFVFDRPDLDVAPGLQIVPEIAVRTHLEGSFDTLHPHIERLQRAGCQPVLCGTPPPKGNNAKLRTLLARETYFVKTAAEMGLNIDEIELSPPWLRLKLWIVLQSLMEEIARRHGVEFVSVPDSVQTEEGFLKEEYWEKDATHANAEYGRVMLDHLAATLNLA